MIDTGQRAGVFQVRGVGHSIGRHAVFAAFITRKLLRQLLFAHQQNRNAGTLVDVAHQLDHVLVDQLVGLVDDHQAVRIVLQQAQRLDHHACNRALRPIDAKLRKQAFAEGPFGPEVEDFKIDRTRLVLDIGAGLGLAVAGRSVEQAKPVHAGRPVDDALRDCVGASDVLQRCHGPETGRNVDIRVHGRHLSNRSVHPRGLVGCRPQGLLSFQVRSPGA